MSDFPLPLNPEALQQALTQMPAPAAAQAPPAAVPPVGPQEPGNVQAQMSPMLPPTQQPRPQPGGPAPDVGQQPGQINFGSSDAAPQPKKKAGPPQPSAMPAIVTLFHQLLGDQSARGYTPGTGSPGEAGAQPARPVSRLDAFEGFLGNFLNSFSQGMVQGGHGPGANARGFGAAMQAPYQRDIQQYELQQQQQQVQAQTGLQQGQAAEAQARASQMGQMVTLPNGMTMPLSLAQKVYPAMIQGQSRVQAAGQQKQYMSTPFGIFDTKAGQMVGGGTSGGIGATVKMTQEMADSGQYGPGAKQLVNKDVKLSDLSAMERAADQGMAFVQGSTGPSRESKFGPTGSLGLGSPAANPIAQQRLQISTAKDARAVETNQNQVNLAIDRLQNLRKNSDVLTNMIDAGKISLVMGDDGITRGVLGRNVSLTPKEKQFAADFQTMSEDINLLRLPQGGGGFRSEEAFEAMQAQRGRLSQNPEVFNAVLDNTLASFRGIQTANQNALDVYNATLKNGRNKATGGGAPPKATGQTADDMLKKYPPAPR